MPRLPRTEAPGCMRQPRVAPTRAHVMPRSHRTPVSRARVPTPVGPPSLHSVLRRGKAVPPVHAHNYKASPPFFRSCRCNSAVAPCPPPSRPSSCIHDRPTTSVPTLGPSGACATASCPVDVETSPEPNSRQPPHGCAIRPPHRPRLCPKKGHKSSQGDPQAVLRPHPAGHDHRFAGIWLDCRRPVPRDPIASPNFFPRVDLQSKGLSVRNLKLPGGYVKLDS
jgi:hypothetical protein